QARRDPEGHEVGERQRRQAHHRLHPAGQQRAPVRDHSADLRDRGRRRRPRLVNAPKENGKTMTTTAPEKKKPARKPAGAKAKAAAPVEEGGVGRIARVTGPVVDIEFPHDAIPDIYNALHTTITIGEDSSELTLEVAQHLGDDLVRAIALKPTDGLVRGQEVRDTGAAISVPVGDVTKGRVFNVIGDVLNAEPGEKIEITERWPI